MIGFQADMICVVGQVMAKQETRAYGTAMALFSLVKMCHFFYKIRGASDCVEVGSIVVLCGGSDGVVVHGKTLVVSLVVSSSLVVESSTKKLSRLVLIVAAYKNDPPIPQAFQKLAEFVGQFLDSDLLA